MTVTPLRVVYASDPAYAPHLAASARSLLANHDGPVEITVLACGLSLGDKDQIQRHVLANPEPVDRCAIVFVEIDDVDINGYSLRNKPEVIDHVSSATFARLVLDHVGPSTGRLLYLDADTIVLGSLDELWNCDLAGNALGAVTDPRIRTAGHRFGVQRRRLTRCKRRAGYFNAGVLLFDIERMRSEQILETARWYLQEAGDDVMFFDQEALNAAIGGRYKRLSPVWNTMSSDPNLTQLQPNARIRHFSAQFKPWTDPDYDSDSHEYFNYAARVAQPS